MNKYLLRKVENGWIVSEPMEYCSNVSGREYVFENLNRVAEWLCQQNGETFTSEY
jgi:hypothetical protein